MKLSTKSKNLKSRGIERKRERQRLGGGGEREQWSSRGERVCVTHSGGALNGKRESCKGTLKTCKNQALREIFIFFLIDPIANGGWMYL